MMLDFNFSFQRMSITGITYFDIVNMPLSHFPLVLIIGNTSYTYFYLRQDIILLKFVM